VIAVLGNHDHWTAPDFLRSALTQAGLVLLRNRAIRRGPLAIIGVVDTFSGHDFRKSRRTVVVSGVLGSRTIPIRLGAPSDWWLFCVGS
jgi:hypothetical protein